jgi:hypothetical protein
MGLLGLTLGTGCIVANPDITPQQQCPLRSRDARKTGL